MVYILLFTIALISILSNILGKKFQMGFSMDMHHFIAYNFINAALASVYFFITNNFRFEINLITFIYSFVFALIVVLSLIIGIVALSKMSVSMSGIISTAGSIILSAVFGAVFLKERLSFGRIMAAVLMLAAVTLPGIRFMKWGKKGALIISLISFVNAGAAVICQKMYTVTPGVLSAESFFLMTNLVIVFMCLVALVIFKTKNPEIKNIYCPFKKTELLNIGLRTVLSNISSVVTILLMQRMDVSVYTVITSSLGVITGAVLSKFYFKEYMAWQNWASAILAIGAFVING